MFRSVVAMSRVGLFRSGLSSGGSPYGIGCGLIAWFGRPGMMDRIGFGNQIPSFDAKEKRIKTKEKKNNKRNNKKETTV